MSTKHTLSIPKEAQRYSAETEYNGIQMRLVGHWIDLAAYYLGSDGNLWAWQSGWSNCGPIVDNPQKHMRGQFWGL